MNAVETSKISYRFGDHLVLDAVNLTVPAGSIYGFLGGNGAGKTTTLRLLLGLLKNQEGEIRLLGRCMTRERKEILSRTGAMIEMPSVYEHLTAYENLRVLQWVYECSQERIGEVLALVGLADTGRKTVRHFSLGMKQRLALGMALLHKPALLILDEPTNGLDPNGIVAMRNLLTQVNSAYGVTVMLSSHALSEIEKVVSHLGILDGGRLVFQGTLAELMEQRQQRTAMLLRTDANEQAWTRILPRYPDAQLKDDHVLVPLTGRPEAAAVNAWLVQEGIGVFEFRPVNGDLESVFMNLINV